MKKIALLFSILMITGTIFAQDGAAPLSKGDKQLNFGTGFTNNGIPVFVSMDFALHKDITLTPEVHVKFDDKIKGGILVKADYHWNYLIGIQVGGRWYWSDKWGMNLEMAGGTGFGTTFGLSMKL